MHHSRIGSPRSILGLKKVPKGDIFLKESPFRHKPPAFFGLSSNETGRLAEADNKKSARTGRFRMAMVRMLLEEFGQRFARLDRIELDRHAFHEVAHDSTAHVAEPDGRTKRWTDIDIDGRAGQ